MQAPRLRRLLQVRRVTGDVNPGALLNGGCGMRGDVRNVIDFHKAAGPGGLSSDPDNMGRFLGGDEVGIGTDCSHLEGPASENRAHAKIDRTMDDLFPVTSQPMPNAMEVALAQTAEEIHNEESSETLKELVRERYRKSVEARYAEKARIEAAERRLNAAVAGTSSTTSEPPPPPQEPEKPKVLRSAGGEVDPFDQVEAMGERLAEFLEAAQGGTRSPAEGAVEPEPKKAERTNATKTAGSREEMKVGEYDDLDAELKALQNRAKVVEVKIAERRLGEKKAAFEAAAVALEERLRQHEAQAAGGQDPVRAKMSMREKVLLKKTADSDIQVMKLKTRILELEYENCTLTLAAKRHGL